MIMILQSFDGRSAPLPHSDLESECDALLTFDPVRVILHSCWTSQVQCLRHVQIVNVCERLPSVFGFPSTGDNGHHRRTERHVPMSDHFIVRALS